MKWTRIAAAIARATYVCVTVCLSFVQIARNILEAHASMLNLTTYDAKLQYIRNWQALQDFGITYFLVKVGKSRKEVRRGVSGKTECSSVPWDQTK